MVQPIVRENQAWCCAIQWPLECTGTPVQCSCSRVDGQSLIATPVRVSLLHKRVDARLHLHPHIVTYQREWWEQANLLTVQSYHLGTVFW